MGPESVLTESLFHLLLGKNKAHRSWKPLEKGVPADLVPTDLATVCRAVHGKNRAQGVFPCATQDLSAEAAIAAIVTTITVPSAVAVPMGGACIAAIVPAAAGMRRTSVAAVSAPPGRAGAPAGSRVVGVGLSLVDGHHAWRHVGYAGKGKACEEGATLPAQCLPCRFLSGFLSFGIALACHSYSAHPGCRTGMPP